MLFRYVMIEHILRDLRFNIYTRPRVPSTCLLLKPNYKGLSDRTFISIPLQKVIVIALHWNKFNAQRVAE